MQGEILRQKYEPFIIFILFYAALASHCCRCTSLDPYSTYMVAPIILSVVTFSFLLLPPREYHTLFIVAFEISFANLGPIVCNFPKYCRFDAAIFIVTVSYLACHLVLLTMMTIRGLSLDDMGLMGLVTRGIWSGFMALVYKEAVALEHDIDLPQYSAQEVHESAALGGSLEYTEKLA